MDQPVLGHHDDALHHDHHSLHDQHLSAMKPPKVRLSQAPNLENGTCFNPQISLRSLSKSDPHLNIPHLLCSQDEDHPSLNQILTGVSGVFQVNNALKTPHRSTQQLPNSVSSVMQRENALTSESSATLLSAPPAPVLRKSSSAVDWAGVSDSYRKPLKSDWQGHISDANGRQLSFNNFSSLTGPHSHTSDHPPHSFDHHQGGLVMSSSGNPQNMSMVASQLPSQSSFAQSLVGSSQAAGASAMAGNPLQPPVEQDRKSHGMFGNMFRQGFFSRPVVRSEEENYRYLMALDR